MALTDNQDFLPVDQTVETLDLSAKLTILGLPDCSNCEKTLKWLDEMFDPKDIVYWKLDKTREDYSELHKYLEKLVIDKKLDTDEKFYFPLCFVNGELVTTGRGIIDQNSFLLEAGLEIKDITISDDLDF